MLSQRQKARETGESSDMPGVQLDFPPIANGVDYLVGVVDHLTADEVGPRELKYAVLHLHAAAEVLLKARLQREHWTLVFDDPRKATRRAFDSGNFQSCNITDAVTRLKEIAQVTLTDNEQNVLKGLGLDRNALQHYGLTHNARAVEARAGRALDFLVRFLDDELVPQLNDDEMDAFPWGMCVRIKKGVKSISVYRAERRKRLLGTLRDVKHRTLTCFECGELALVVRDRCHFCSFPFGNFHPEHAADMYLATRYRDAQKLISNCPRCTRRALGQGVVTVASDGPVTFCFSCAVPVPVPDAQTGEPSATPEGRP
ncbi:MULTISPECIES: hypothetical protein [Streptomyces]|uniref:Uncharacterized protein n=1 Tax=Streptomyces lonegramiae TaxID=3075524 RepID=A0ABU2XQC6_9ACTN|nr:hypothetical protein [Streptomyces sp. DSM 41529]MDT0547652.1 hypothetical protein [Streptomyces sp. DSM 41529]